MAMLLAVLLLDLSGPAAKLFVGIGRGNKAVGWAMGPSLERQRVLLRKKLKPVRDFKHLLASDMHQASKVKENVESLSFSGNFSEAALSNSSKTASELTEAESSVQKWCGFFRKLDVIKDTSETETGSQKLPAVLYF